MKTVPVGPFAVADIHAEQLPQHLASLAAARSRRVIAFALHVGGLNKSTDRAFVEAMNAADIIYADGASAVLIARAGGASEITRASTTDIGLQTIDLLSETLGRPARLALVGGPPGLAAQAGRTLRDEAACDIVYASDGYGRPLAGHAETLRTVAPDLILVGLGMPLEARAVAESADLLPPSLIMTCGGWFGFLAGHERRAPTVLRRVGLEWLWRLAQSPGRLAARYAVGALTTARHILNASLRRLMGMYSA